MATLELEREQVLSVEEQAQRHNAMINERYRRLRDAENNQFARETQDVRASVIAPEKPVFVAPVAESPVVEQMPQITEFVPTHTMRSTFFSAAYAPTSACIASESVPSSNISPKIATVRVSAIHSKSIPAFMETGLAL